MSFDTIITILKGGSGSGNFGHTGRPGKIGGSAPDQFSSSDIANALQVVQNLILSGGDMDLKLTDGARQFLHQTVEDKDYILQRGMHLMRFRVDKANWDELNNLQVGDSVPNYLIKQGTNYTSFTSKPSVAKHYSKEGHLGLIIEATVPKSQVVVDLKNLPKVLNQHGVKHDFDEEDFNYFKRDAEVIVDGLPKSVVISKYGKL